MKKTSLHEFHLALGAKMIEYAGFDMPIYYTDIAKEHLAVRSQMGIFDVSHMGEIIVEGSEALKFVNYLITNQIDSILNKVTYSLMCDHEGFVVDDLLVYVITPEKILLVVNASNLEKDFDWILNHVHDFEVSVRNVSENMSQIAIQGPETINHIDQIVGVPSTDLTFMTFRVVPVQTGHVIISRTGYTGEDGFEIYGDHDLIKSLWQKAIEFHAIPCGLGARDTLRFEANLPLYGHEISDSITPLEAGLGFAVKLEKDFIGKQKLFVQKESLTRKVVGLELLDKGIPRQGYEVINDQDHVIGYITTGYLSPTLNKPIALAMIDITYSSLKTSLFVQVRKSKIPAVVIGRKFLKKNYKK